MSVPFLVHKKSYTLESRPLLFPVRHFLWYCCPLLPTSTGAGVSVLDWQLERIQKILPQFTGVRKCAIAVPTSKAEEKLFAKYSDVAERWNAMGVETFAVPNNTEMREGPAFVELLKMCPGGADDIAFFGHSKGVTRGATDKAIRWWTEVMMETVMENIAGAEYSLSTNGVTGSFKKYGEFNLPGNNVWHYSGSFFWMRLSDVFQRDWEFLHNFFASVEAWPGFQFKRGEAGCLFGDRVGHLYDLLYWKKVVWKQLDKWRDGCCSVFPR